MSARLVATAVGLVLLVSLLFGAATVVALRSYLDHQLDRALFAFQKDPGPGAIPDADDRLGRGHDGDGPGTDAAPSRRDFVVLVDAAGKAYEPTFGGGWTPLLGPSSDAYASVAADGEVHALSVGDRTFRVVAEPKGGGLVLVTGVLDEVDKTVSDLVPWMALFILLGTAAAAGGGTYLVRRQLRPLREVADTAHEVAALPLASGAVAIPARVPQRLTDERTEVGQVGSALNTLLGHVEGALGARHRSEQQVRQFVADASHELRTPLATIQGYAELARRTHAREPEELLRALEKVEAEGVRMTSLVEDLLLLARLDAGRPLAHDEVDLTRLVLEAVSDARVVSPDHRWRLQLPDDPVDVPGDELRIRQVLVNLLANAARHTPPGTTVTVTVASDGSGQLARVEVHDDGPGVPESLQPTVFERFTRADSARTREVGGAGLGLSLARAIARAHDGDLTLASQPGSTTFALTLPTAAAAAAVPVPASQSL